MGVLRARVLLGGFRRAVRIGDDRGAAPPAPVGKVGGRYGPADGAQFVQPADGVATRVPVSGALSRGHCAFRAASRTPHCLGGVWWILIDGLRDPAGGGDGRDTASLCRSTRSQGPRREDRDRRSTRHPLAVGISSAPAFGAGVPARGGARSAPSWRGRASSRSRTRTRRPWSWGTRTALSVAGSPGRWVSTTMPTGSIVGAEMRGVPPTRRIPSQPEPDRPSSLPPRVTGPA